MSRSTKRHQREIRRMAKNVKGPDNPRAQPEFQFEALDTTLTVHSDSESAVCRSSRRSTSGAGTVVSTNIMVVKQWSSTQRSVVLSSCEAELHAMNKGAAEAMGIRSLAADMGITFDILLRTDPSAGLVSVNRRHVGESRHIDTEELCLQNAIRNRELEVQKVAGEENVADMQTKSVKAEVLEKHMAEMECTKTTRRDMDDKLTGAHIQLPISLRSEEDQCSVESIGSVVHRKQKQPK